MALLALIGLAAAVAVRPVLPQRAAEGTPGPMVHAADGGGVLLTHGSGRFRVSIAAPKDGTREAWLLPTEPLDFPDLLLYATALKARGGGLPKDARLLGPGAQAVPTRLEVPAATRALLLFSLAHQEVKATLELNGARPSTDGAER